MYLVGWHFFLLENPYRASFGSTFSGILPAITNCTLMGESESWFPALSLWVPMDKFSGKVLRGTEASSHVALGTYLLLSVSSSF